MRGDDPYSSTSEAQIQRCGSRTRRRSSYWAHRERCVEEVSGNVCTDGGVEPPVWNAEEIKRGILLAAKYGSIPYWFRPHHIARRPHSTRSTFKLQYKRLVPFILTRRRRLKRGHSCWILGVKDQCRGRVTRLPRLVRAVPWPGQRRARLWRRMCPVHLPRARAGHRRAG